MNVEIDKNKRMNDSSYVAQLIDNADIDCEVCSQLGNNLFCLYDNEVLEIAKTFIKKEENNYGDDYEYNIYKIKVVSVLENLHQNRASDLRLILNDNTDELLNKYQNIVSEKNNKNIERDD